MLNFFAISRIGAARASPLFSSSPLWATLLAVIFLGERPHWVVVVGTLCIVAGAIIIVAERQRERAQAAVHRTLGDKTLVPKSTQRTQGLSQAMEHEGVGPARMIRMALVCHGPLPPLGPLDMHVGLHQGSSTALGA